MDEKIPITGYGLVFGVCCLGGNIQQRATHTHTIKSERDIDRYSSPFIVQSVAMLCNAHIFIIDSGCGWRGWALGWWWWKVEVGVVEFTLSPVVAVCLSTNIIINWTVWETTTKPKLNIDHQCCGYLTIRGGTADCRAIALSTYRRIRPLWLGLPFGKLILQSNFIIADCWILHNTYLFNKIESTRASKLWRKLSNEQCRRVERMMGDGLVSRPQSSKYQSYVQFIADCRMAANNLLYEFRCQPFVAAAAAAESESGTLTECAWYSCWRQ